MRFKQFYLTENVKNRKDLETLARAYKDVLEKNSVEYLKELSKSQNKYVINIELLSKDIRWNQYSFKDEEFNLFINEIFKENNIGVRLLTRSPKSGTRGSFHSAKMNDKFMAKYSRITMHTDPVETMQLINQTKEHNFKDSLATRFLSDDLVKLLDVSVLVHELQHFFDGWRSKGKALDKSKEIEELYTSDDKELAHIAYLQFPHEINARYSQTITDLIPRITHKDSSWKSVVGYFKDQIKGWDYFTEKTRKRLLKRLAMDYNVLRRKFIARKFNIGTRVIVTFDDSDNTITIQRIENFDKDLEKLIRTAKKERVSLMLSKAKQEMWNIPDTTLIKLGFKTRKQDQHWVKK